MLPPGSPLSRLMLVTDGAAAHTPEGEARLVAAVRGGAGIVQLRDRSVGMLAMMDRARLLRRLLPDTLLIANRCPEAVYARDADGVQFGAGELPLPRARHMVGARALIGCSVHSVAEAEAAATDGADFLVVGTIYPTATHPGKAPEGPELLQAVAAAVRVPFYAIGGITAANAGECVRRGAHGVAVMGAIRDAPDSEAAARSLVASMEAALQSNPLR